jgi:diacylglycerol diphosphate phosphatase / phosphatidate phosphatase
MTLPLLHTRLQTLYNNIPNFADLGINNNGNANGNGKPLWRRFLWDLVGFACFYALVFLFYMILKPPPLWFRADDDSLSYYSGQPTVPSVLVALLSLLLPVLVILILNVFFWYNKYDVYSGILGVLLAYTLALFFTSALWVFVGGLRPYFLQTCNVDRTLLVQGQMYYSTDSNVCSNSGSFTRDTFHGFPSGHASTSFAGFTFLSAYLASHFRIYRNGNVFKLFLAFVPFLFAIWMSTSRLRDHYHNVNQVIAGALIGFISALIAYRWAYVQGFLLGFGEWAHVPNSRYKTI